MLKRLLSRRSFSAGRIFLSCLFVHFVVATPASAQLVILTNAPAWPVTNQPNQIAALQLDPADWLVISNFPLRNATGGQVRAFGGLYLRPASSGSGISSNTANYIVGQIGSNLFDLAGSSAAISNAIVALGYVTGGITNGLATEAYVTSATGTLWTAILSLTNGFVTGTITNGLATASSLNSTAATLTASIENSRTNAIATNATASVQGFRVGLPPGAASVFGSTNDALLAGVAGANANWDELQFSDTTEQRARWVIPAPITSRWQGGALTNQIWWRGTSTVGAVVWQIGMMGATNNGLADLAYQNLTIGSNTVSSTASNLNVTSIIITPTNCPAGSLWLYELRRIPGNSSDTMVNDARVVSVGVQE